MTHLLWIHTSDIHGALFCNDANSRKATAPAADAVGTDVPSCNMIISDGGDQLQGNAVTYYSNYLSDASQPHIIAAAMNDMHYDVGCLGNHDIEAGMDACRRWRDACAFPVLGANVIDENTGKPALPPSAVIERQGIRIAVIGLVTTAIPHWLHNNLWKGWRFADTVETARQWIETIRSKEHSDMTVGLLHTGWQGGMFNENETRRIAESVPGFDLILYGHDHHQAVHSVKNSEGKSVLCIAPSALATSAVVVDIYIDKKGDCVKGLELHGEVRPWQDVEHLLPHRKVPQEVARWQKEEVCRLDNDILERDSFFGPSAFVDIMHRALLSATDTQISFASPVRYDTCINRGVLDNQSMFAFYPFETQTYVMRLTGEEIRNALEYSYSLWVSTMHKPDDEALLLDYVFDGGKRKGLKTLSFNLLSAAGIRYSVWLDKPVGNKVVIESMSNGIPFDKDSTYSVAINSYHGNGGGDILTQGAGISHDELPQRIVRILPFSTRHHLTSYLRSLHTTTLHSLNHWSFQPVQLVTAELEQEKKMLF